MFMIDKRDLKHLYQKITRGFSNKDLWALDWTIAKYIHNNIRVDKSIGFDIYINFMESMRLIASGDGGSFIDELDDKPNSRELYEQMCDSIYQGRHLFLRPQIRKFILPRLKEFRRLTVGYPSNLKSMERWQYMLDCMIYDLQTNNNGQGLKWFGSYFRCLWW